MRWVSWCSLTESWGVAFEGELFFLFFSFTHRHTQTTNRHSLRHNTRVHTWKCYSLFSWEKPLVHRQANTNQTDLPCIPLSCGSRTLAALLRKQQFGFFQGPRVKGLLWLHARLVTGNIEIWLSSGIYPLTLLNVPVCSSVDGMWEFMCTTRWLCLSFKGILF